MNVLIAGGAGFLGSHLCERMIREGNDVICIDDFSSGKIENIESLIGREEFKTMNLDISKKFEIEEKIDLIFNLASPAAPLQYQKIPVQTMLTNALGSFNLLNLARKNNCPIVLASTSEIYGDAKIIPTPEDYWGNVNPTGVRSCYDESKRFAEALFKAFEREYNLDVRIVRIFNTYGERMRGDGNYGRVVPNFIMQCLKSKPITVYGDGTQTRSFCYVSDTIDALVRVAENEEAKGEVFNVGNPKEITILELAKIIKKLTGSYSRIKFYPLPEDDPKRRCPDISKIKEILRWEPKVSLEEGLRKTIDWFKKVHLKVFE